MNAIDRIEKYISERKKSRGLDIENIHGMHGGDDREATLLLSDLEWLLSEAKKNRP